MNELPTFLRMHPYLREMIWGGRRLGESYGKALPAGKLIGESWEVSAYEGMESVVEGGPLDGWDLRRLAAEHGGHLLGRDVADRYDGEFPLLIKLLDANQDLSIQVHPDDAYAQANGLGRFGKMEAWYVLRSDGARIAYGLSEGVDSEAFREAIVSGRVADAVRYMETTDGDVVPLMPGTVHALCSGVMIYEVQQTSDLTFRIYDYGRPGPDGNPRELHIEQSMDVIDFDSAQPAVLRPSDEIVLVETEHFRLERLCVDGSATGRAAIGSFSALTAIDGSVGLVAGEEVKMSLGETVLVPAGRAYSVRGQGEVLVSSVPG